MIRSKLRFFEGLIRFAEKSIPHQFSSGPWWLGNGVVATPPGERNAASPNLKKTFINSEGREYPIRSPKGGDGNSPSKLAEEDELFSVRGLSPDTRLPPRRGSQS